MATSHKTESRFIKKRDFFLTIIRLKEGNKKMEQIKMYKNSEKYGFKKDDVFTVLRNIMNECVIIMADEQMPNLILQESTAKKYGTITRY